MIHNILWTGGWDSTYRVLDLVLNKKKVIQPYYIIDERRKSTKTEIKTMNRIKTMMIDIDKDAADRINNTIYMKRLDIPTNNTISDYYKTLKSQSHLGDQYDWLARYTHDKGIKDLELCVHKDDTVEGFIKDDVELILLDNDQYYKLIDQPSQKELKIFSYYHFPLFNMTKLQMGKNAKEYGFDHIMEITWFCHTPYRGRPCGMCNPCKYTREEGLGRRVPRATTIMKFNRKINNKLLAIKKRIIS